MSTVDVSTNPQITQEESINPHATEQQKIDKIAGEMASKAGKVEHQSEKSGDTVGGVRSNSGGIFTK